MKGFVQALKLVGVYFLMYAVFTTLSALVLGNDKMQGKVKVKAPHVEDVTPQDASTVMPTATLWISGDSPFSSGPAKCIDGTMYVYADRNIALYVSSGKDGVPGDGSVVVIYVLTKEQGKNVLKPVAHCMRNPDDGTVGFTGNPSLRTALYFDGYKANKVYEYSAGIMTEYADMHAEDNRPCNLIGDSQLAEAAHFVTPDAAKERVAQQQAQQLAQYQHDKDASSYGTPVLVVMAILVAVMLVIFLAVKNSIDNAEYDISRNPVLYDSSDDGNQISIYPNMPALPSWFAAAQFAALAVVGVEIAVFAVPSFAEVVLSSGFSDVFYGIGFVVLAIALMLLQFLVFDNLYSRIGLAEGCGNDDEGALATIVQMGAIVVFNFMGFVYALGTANVLPLIFANLCLAVPTTVKDWRRSYARTPMHWLQLLNEMFIWMSLGVLIAAWMVAKAFVTLLDMKIASDEAEAAAAARRRQQEGNDFIVGDGNGGTLTMHRIGDSDEFACSDGHTYRREAGDANCYGDYDRQY